MALTETEKQTVRYYKTGEWLGWLAAKLPADPEAVHSYYAKEMRRLFQLFPPPAKILEVGPGAGLCARDLISLGYDYIGLEPAWPCLKAVRERSGGKLIQAAAPDLCFAKDSFDVFWSGCTLLHLSKERVDTALSVLRWVVRPGGMGFVAMKEGVSEGLDERGVYYAYYTPVKFAKILDRNGMAVVGQWTHPDPRGEHPIMSFLVRVD